MLYRVTWHNSTMNHIRLVTGHTDNRRLIEVLQTFSNGLVGPDHPHWCCPGDQVEDPGYGLGCHPDLVLYVWDTVTQSLPKDCRWSVAARPCLVHPESGRIFLWASGHSLHGLRLSPEDRHAYQGAAVAQANRRADEFGLQGTAREKYLLHHTGDRLMFSGGSEFEAASLGPDWVIGRSLEDETAWVLKAFEFAGRAS